jgi:hypothetical protein
MATQNGDGFEGMSGRSKEVGRRKLVLVMMAGFTMTTNGTMVVVVKMAGEDTHDAGNGIEMLSSSRLVLAMASMGPPTPWYHQREAWHLQTPLPVIPKLSKAVVTQVAAKQDDVDSSEEELAGQVLRAAVIFLERVPYAMMIMIPSSCHLIRNVMVIGESATMLGWV